MLATLRGIRAVLFDMDGTLVDSDAAVARAWVRWAEQRGLDATELLEVSPGRPASGTIALVFPHLAPDGVAREAAEQLALQYDDLSDVHAAPGAERAVAVVAGAGRLWAVVTSADHRLAGARLRAAGVEPPVLVTSEDIAHGKPAPDGYLAAARRLGVEPSACLVVEDAAVGIEAGRRAGMLTAGLRGAGGDVAIADLDALADLLSSAWAA